MNWAAVLPADEEGDAEKGDDEAEGDDAAEGDDTAQHSTTTPSSFDTSTEARGDARTLTDLLKPGVANVRVVTVGEKKSRLARPRARDIDLRDLSKGKPGRRDTAAAKGPSPLHGPAASAERAAVDREAAAT